MLISFSGRTKQIFFLVIKLEPRLLSWLQPRKNNYLPTELDVSILAYVIRSNCHRSLSKKKWSFLNDLRHVTQLTTQDSRPKNYPLWLLGQIFLSYHKTWYNCVTTILPTKRSNMSDQRILNRWRKNWIFRCPLKAESWSFYYIHSTKLWGIIN